MSKRPEGTKVLSAAMLRRGVGALVGLATLSACGPSSPAAWAQGSSFVLAALSDAANQPEPDRGSVPPNGGSGRPGTTLESFPDGATGLPPGDLPGTTSPATGGGGGGAGAPAGHSATPLPLRRLAGQLVSDGPEGEGGPVAGALVEAFTPWGRTEAISGPDGVFEIESSGLPSLLSVRADGHLPSLAAEWAGGLLHLRQGALEVQREPSQVPFSGRVVDALGQGVAGAKVVAQDAWGARFGLATTEADGRFLGLGVVYGALAPCGLSIWAWEADEQGGLLRLGHGVKQANAQGAVGEVLLTEAVGEWALQSAQGPEGQEEAQLWGVDELGLRISLMAWAERLQGPPTLKRFQLPGVRFELELQREGPGGTRSGVRMPLGAAGSVQVRLLDFLAVEGAVRPGGQLRWGALPDATSYVLEARNRLTGLPLWEGHTTLPAWQMPQDSLPAGEGLLQVTALAGRGGAPSELLSVGLGLGPKALRWAPSSARAERWSRQLLGWVP